MTTCGCKTWEHQLFGGCVPPNPPRPCCSTTDWDRDSRAYCENGRCTLWFCWCGAYTGMAAGPVLCGCKSDRGYGHMGGWPKVSVPGGAKFGARQRRKRVRP